MEVVEIMKKMKILASICVILGVVVMAIPFLYHYRGQEKTEALLSRFEKTLEEETDEKDKWASQSEKTRHSEEKKAFLGETNIIGIIKIEAIDVSLPILEGVGTTSLDYAIGHLSETAAIGTNGNCVLAGHNGSRNGEFFTNLNKLVAGDIVKLIDVYGETHLYEVANSYVTEPYDQEVKIQGDKELLTLITCAEKGTKRLIVKCEPVKVGD